MNKPILMLFKLTFAGLFLFMMVFIMNRKSAITTVFLIWQWLIIMLASHILRSLNSIHVLLYTRLF